MSMTLHHLAGIPQAGEIIACKYKIERFLGAGGMGAVVEAWDLLLERRVAIKFLLPEAAHLDDAGPRFLRDARAAASLRSEHVARVIDLGELPTGAPYMVLEHLQGLDLSAYLKQRGPLPIAMAVDLLLQAGEAMAEAHAHARGIVHRDSSPVTTRNLLTENSMP